MATQYLERTAASIVTGPFLWLPLGRIMGWRAASSRSKAHVTRGGRGSGVAKYSFSISAAMLGTQTRQPEAPSMPAVRLSSEHFEHDSASPATAVSEHGQPYGRRMCPHGAAGGVASRCLPGGALALRFGGGGAIAGGGAGAVGSVGLGISSRLQIGWSSSLALLKEAPKEGAPAPCARTHTQKLIYGGW